MCLQALDYAHATEDEVNKVMGALPMRGAAWEQALACAQHYGCRATLTMPSTVKQLKEWTDKGIPVMIAWNPEGRDWSHASVVFDVDEDYNVYVADPNLPDPEETVRVVPKAEFYSKWYEKWPNYLVRRPACAIEREITPDGKQIMASSKKENKVSKRELTAKDLLKEVREIKSNLGRLASKRRNAPTKKLTRQVQKAVMGLAGSSMAKNSKPAVFLGSVFGDKGRISIRYSSDYGVPSEKNLDTNLEKTLNREFPEYIFDVQLEDYRYQEGGPITGWDGGPVYDADGFYVRRPYTANVEFNVIVNYR